MQQARCILIITRLCEVLPDQDLAKLLARPNSRGRSPLHCTFDKYLDGDPLYRNNPDSDVANTVGKIVDFWESCTRSLVSASTCRDSAPRHVFGSEVRSRGLSEHSARCWCKPRLFAIRWHSTHNRRSGGRIGSSPAHAAGGWCRSASNGGADQRDGASTSVHTAGTEDECVSICKDLLDAGSDVNALDAEDKLVIAWAAEHKREKLVCCCLVALLSPSHLWVL